MNICLNLIDVNDEVRVFFSVPFVYTVCLAKPLEKFASSYPFEELGLEKGLCNGKKEFE